MRLNANPLSAISVEIALSGSAYASVTLDQAVLDFDSGNWFDGVTVVVSGVEDANVIDGEVTAVVRLSDVSSGVYRHGRYGSVGASAVLSLSVADDDAVGFVVSGGATGLYEDGRRVLSGVVGAGVVVAEFGVVLRSQPVELVAIELMTGLVSGSASAGFGVERLLFDSSNWHIGQTVLLSAISDSDVRDGLIDVLFAVSSASSESWGGTDAVDASVRYAVLVEDDDAATLTLSPRSLVLVEGEDEAFVVRLNADPLVSVSVEITLVASAYASVTLDQAVLDFDGNNWSDGVTVVVSGVEDAEGIDGSVTVIVRLSDVSAGVYRNEHYGVAPASDVLSLSVADDDEVELVVSGGATSVYEDGRRIRAGDVGAGDVGAAFGVVLSVQPLELVEVELSAAVLSGVASVRLSVERLLFDSSNWHIGQTVLLSAVSDSDVRDGLIDVLFAVSSASSESWGGTDAVDASVRYAVLVEDDDAATLTLSVARLSLLEGASAEFAVRLNANPLSAISVEIALSGSAYASVTLDQAVLDFDSGNWFDGVTVVVSGVEDANVIDGEVTAVVRLSDVSSGVYRHGRYGSVGASAVLSLLVADDDAVGFVVSGGATGLYEDGRRVLSGVVGAGVVVAEFGVVLRSQPVELVAIELMTGLVSGSASAGFGVERLLFDSSNWHIGQTVLLSAISDSDVRDGLIDVLFAVSSASSESWGGTDAVDASVRYAVLVEDDDAATLTLSPRSLVLVEGEDEAFVVRLNADPLVSVSVEITLVASTYASVTLDQAVLDFDGNNWSDGVTVVVSGVEDAEGIDGLVTVIVRLSDVSAGVYRNEHYGVAPASDVLSLSVADDDEVELVVSGGATSVYEDGRRIRAGDVGAGDVGAAFGVVLSVQPLELVEVELSAAVLSGVASVRLSVERLLFDSSNWHIGQTVLLSAVSDSDVRDGLIDVLFAVSSASSESWGGTDAVDASVRYAVLVEDDDAATLTLSVARLSLLEGASAEFAVRLNANPLSAISVEIALSGSAYASVTLDQAVLDFDSGNWFDGVTVVVSGVEDANVIDGEVTAVVRLSDVSSGVYRHGRYGSVGASAVLSLSVADDDAVGFVVSGGATGLYEDGRRVLSGVVGAGVVVAEFGVVLRSQPVELVAIELMTGLVSGSASAGFGVERLLFDSSNWHIGQTVLLSAISDSDVRDGLIDVLFAVSSASSESWGGTDAVDASVRYAVLVEDDDAATLTLSPRSLVLVEGEDEAFVVRLNADPLVSVSVEITLVASAYASVTLDQAVLDFDGNNWSDGVTVVVSGVEDAEGIDGSVTVIVRLSDVSAGVYRNEHYGAAPASDVLSLSVADDDEVELVVSGGATSIYEDGRRIRAGVVGFGRVSASLSVALTVRPIDSVLIEFGSEVVSGSVSGRFVDILGNERSHLLFDSSNWQLSQTVFFEALADADSRAGGVELSLAVAEVSSGSWGVGDVVVRRSVEVLIEDDDAADVIVELSDLPVMIEAEASAPLSVSSRFVVRLSADPIDVVSIEAKALAVSYASVQLELLTGVVTDVIYFGSHNWLDGELLRVRSLVDEDIFAGWVTMVFEVSDSGLYSNEGYGYSRASAVLGVEVIDRDEARILVGSLSGVAGVTALITVDEGATSGLLLRLNSAPQGEVKVLLTVATDVVNASISLSIDELIFNTSNWHQRQLVVVSGVEDEDSFYAMSTVTVRVSADSQAVFGEAEAQVVVDINDNDPPVLDLVSATLVGLKPQESRYSFYGDSEAHYILATSSTVSVEAVVNDIDYDGGDLYYIATTGASALLVRRIEPRGEAPEVSLFNATSTMAVAVDASLTMEYYIYESGELPLTGAVDFVAVRESLVSGSQTLDLSDGRGVLFRYKATEDVLASRVDLPRRLGLGFVLSGSVNVEGNRLVSLEVALDRAFDEDVLFGYDISGSALAGSDYRLASSETLRIVAGELTQRIKIRLIDDRVSESLKELIVVLRKPENMELTASSRYRLAIEDNDAVIKFPQVATATLVEVGIDRDPVGRGWYLDPVTDYIFEAAITPQIEMMNGLDILLDSSGDKEYKVMRAPSGTIVQIVSVPELDEVFGYAGNEGYPLVYINIERTGKLGNALRDTMVWDAQGQRIIVLDAQFVSLDSKSATVPFDGDLSSRGLASVQAIEAVSAMPQIVAESLVANKRYGLFGYSRGVYQEVASGVSSQSGVIEGWHYVKPLDFGDNLLILSGSLSLPLPVRVPAPFEISAEVNKSKVSLGDILTYKVRVKNVSSVTYDHVRVLDVVPRGFKYMKETGRYTSGTGTLSSLPLEPERYGGSEAVIFRFASQSFAPGEVRYVYYQMVVGAGIGRGEHEHSLVVGQALTTTLSVFDSVVLSERAKLKIRVVEDALFDLGHIIGKVYDDRNSNGIQDRGELGVAYAKIHTDKGYVITADEHGQYHLANVRPGRHALVLDKYSLPAGAEFVGRLAQIANISRGLPVKVNFAVRLPAQKALPSEADEPKAVLPRRAPVKSFKLAKVEGDIAPYLNVSLYQLPRSSDGLLAEDLEFRVFTNYPLHINRWNLRIKDLTAGGRVIKVLRGGRSSLLEAIVWDGVMADGRLIQLGRTYSYELAVEGIGGKVDWTIERLFSVKAGDVVVDRNAWVERELLRDTTARRGIRPIGEKVRILRRGYKPLYILRSGREVLRLPMVKRPRSGGGLEDSHHLEIILPKGSYKIRSRGAKLHSSNVFAPVEWFAGLLDVVVAKGFAAEGDEAIEELRRADDELSALEEALRQLDVDVGGSLVEEAGISDDELSDLRSLLSGLEGEVGDVSAVEVVEEAEPLVEAESVVEVEAEDLSAEEFIEGEEDFLQAREVLTDWTEPLSDEEISLDILLDDEDVEQVAEEQPAERDFFLVGLADFEIGDNKVEGVIDQLTQDEYGYHYKSGLWKRGKLSYFLRGTIRGDYFVSSSYDSERRRDDIFAQLDPNKEYPVYGDSSVLDDSAAEGRGRFYLLVEKNESSLKWGNFEAALNDGELVGFERQLYGGKYHYESVSQTKYGRPKVKVVGFYSASKERGAKNEMLLTGGSLYYLKHDEIVPRSVVVRVEQRDKINGNVVAEVDLLYREDYDVDYESGKLTLLKRLVKGRHSRFIISGDLNGEDELYLVVSYDYDSGDDVDEAVQGLRLEKSLGDGHLGISALRDNEALYAHDLSGADFALRGERGYLAVEYGKSKNASVNRVYYSDDGGISFRDGVVSNAQAGEALRASFRLDSGEDKRFRLSAYHRDVEGGYSSLLTDSQRGKRSSGIDFIFEPIADTQLRLSYDDVELDELSAMATAGYLVGDVIGGKGEQVSVFQFSRHKSRYGVTLEYRREDVERSNLLTASASETIDEVLALRADYLFTEGMSGYVQYESDLTGDKESRTSFGVEMALNDYVSLRLGAAQLDDENDRFDALATLVGRGEYELAPGVVLRGEASVSSDGRVDYGLRGGRSYRAGGSYRLAEGIDVKTDVSGQARLDEHGRLVYDGELGSDVKIDYDNDYFGVEGEAKVRVNEAGEIVYDYGAQASKDVRLNYSNDYIDFNSDNVVKINDKGEYDYGNETQVGVGVDYQLNDNIQLSAGGRASGELNRLGEAYDGDVDVGLAAAYDLGSGRAFNFRAYRQDDLDGSGSSDELSLGGKQLLGGGYQLEATADVLSDDAGVKSDQQLSLTKEEIGRKLQLGLVNYKHDLVTYRQGHRLLYKDNYDLSEAWRLKAGVEYDVSEDRMSRRQREVRSGAALEYLGDGFYGDVNIEQSYVKPSEGGVVERQLAALSFSQQDIDEQTGGRNVESSLQLEYRSDEGVEGNSASLAQYRARGYIRGRLLTDVSLHGALDYDKIENKITAEVERDELRVDLGFAYRPIGHDSLNLFGKLSLLDHKVVGNSNSKLSDNGELDISNITSERAVVFALDAIFEDEEFELTEKLAYRRGEEEILGFVRSESDYWLWINKLTYKLTSDNRFGLEYRLLRHKQARDSRSGWVLSFSSRLNDYVELEAGYSFTELNDDLADLDFTVKGPYLRLTGVLAH